MEFRLFKPIAPLKGYIAKIWAFESDGPLPNDDMKLIVPNGRLLLIIPFRNGLVGRMDGRHYVTKNNKMALVGISDRPSMVDSETSGPTGSIGVEISPAGAYRFFHLKLGDVRNQLNNLVDILGKPARSIEARMIDENSIEGKIQVLQTFLYKLMIQKEEDSLFEYCVRKIKASGGGIKIKDLGEDTGYSTRWLNIKFQQRLGVSPKNFCSIVRFQKYYQALILKNNFLLNKSSLYDHYYDESHFVKEFKKFTGVPPSELIRSKNDFGAMFYQD